MLHSQRKSNYFYQIKKYPLFEFLTSLFHMFMNQWLMPKNNIFKSSMVPDKDDHSGDHSSGNIIPQVGAIIAGIWEDNS